MIELHAPQRNRFMRRFILEGRAGSCRVVVPVHFTTTGCSRRQSADCHVELREEVQPSQLTVLCAVTNFTSRTVWETLGESRHRYFFLFIFLNLPDSVRQLSYWSLSKYFGVFCCNLAYVSRSSVRSHRIRHRCLTSWTERTRKRNYDAALLPYKHIRLI